MNQRRRKRNSGILWGMVLLGIVYSALLAFRHPLTGTNLRDGILGVLLGLYICSHPAANLLDMILFDGAGGLPFPSRRSIVLWLTLNLLVLLVGWLIIFVGTTQFSAPHG